MIACTCGWSSERDCDWSCAVCERGRDNANVRTIVGHPPFGRQASSEIELPEE
jgi:hypothetical protein